ncbi:MAG: alkaline phosphatase family protein [Actinomycetota bacterium]|nr:alkaline phosphatase family protein [Actinomycetota bacterium]
MISSLRRGGVAVLAAFAVGCSAQTNDEGPRAARALAGTRPVFASDDPVERGCALPQSYLTRIWRGYHPDHSEDVTMVPRYPNYFGSFTYRGHSGPWRYLQQVPLVLYGPGHINGSGRVRRAVDLRDIYPTVGQLLGAPLPERSGSVLSEALAQDGSIRPRLVVVVMWDGVGRNVLERWPKAWPNLRRLERVGTTYFNTLVGSSPSITPATHSTLGTGEFPKDHGVTGIEYRTDRGNVSTAFAGVDPRDLKLSTFADVIDRDLHNRPKVGMLAWRSWHLGMLGHGRAAPGGDADELALVGSHGKLSGIPSFYSTPRYMKNLGGFEADVERLDRSDGRIDGKWMGTPISEDEDNPAWVWYESDALQTMLRRGHYGADKIPDLFFTNFKSTDLVGHQFSMDSPRMKAVLHAQDAALGRLVRWLETDVRNFTLIVSADHGHTPNANRTGAWPVMQTELKHDIDRHFKVPSDKSLVLTTSATGPFLNHRLMKQLGVTADDVARFMNSYTISDNWSGSRLPDGYRDRGNEEIFSAVFPGSRLPEIMACASGSPTPVSSPSF